MPPDENDYQFNCSFDADLEKVMKNDIAFGYDSMSSDNFLMELDEVDTSQSLKKITNKFLNNYLRLLHKIFRYHIPLSIIKFLSIFILIEKKIFENISKA